MPDGADCPDQSALLVVFNETAHLLPDETTTRVAVIGIDLAGAS
jgi:hypothetical protein